MRRTPLAVALAMAFGAPVSVTWAQQDRPAEDAGMTRSLGVVTVTGSRPTSLPTQIPTTVEGVTREEIETRINANTYFGASKYFTVDTRVRYQVTRQVSAAFGIDNANNDPYWNFHPYPQRTYTAELRWDL